MSQAVDVSDSTWETAVLQSDVPVLVDFWAEWCGPCRAMSPYVDKLAEEFDGKLKVVKLNTQDNNEVPARYGVISIPTFLLIKDGEVKQQIVGSQPYDKFKELVTANI
jgi:thioredoxin 1